MGLASFTRFECRIINRTPTGTADRYNNPTWVDATPIAATCMWSPRSSDDTVVSGVATAVVGATDYVAVFAPDTNIGEHARVEMAFGWTGEVVGPPRHIPRPLAGKIHRIEVNLREVS